VTVRAEEDTLGHLGSETLERQRQAAGADPQPLVVWVDVVKLERRQAPVITTGLAAAACLIDEQLL
jgi:hypothetical protein